MARVPAPGSDNTPEGQHLAALADDAAARAPDTAAADEAKRKVYEDAARGVLASAPDALAKAPVSKAEAQQPSGSEPMASLPSKPSDSGTMSPAPDNSTSDATTAESNSSSSPRVEKT
jgi:hypothetical protein